MSETNPVWAALDLHLPGAITPKLDPAAQWDSDRRVLYAMQRFGGGFIQALAEAFLHADQQNRAKIKATWPEYWSKYSEMAKSMKEEP